MSAMPETSTQECTIWCKNCNIAICDECLEGEHDGHSMRKLKRYLIEKFEAKLGKSLKDEILEYREEIEKIIGSKRCEVEKSQMASIESEIALAEKEKKCCVITRNCS